MSTANTRIIRLLDRGFYPMELPPPFRVRNFSKIRGLLQPPMNYSGSTSFFDGGTFRGQLRRFGIINPVNYFLLARFVANHWDDITKVYRLSTLTGSRPTFPALATSGRAIKDASIGEKRRSQQHLASGFPIILALDINQFYGSLYTHSIPWAVLGKQQAKRLFRNRQLHNHWSDQLDQLVRNCNQSQTVGIPIGPDTSRIISELILSRIDAEIVANGTGIRSSQVYHNIDDYQFGVSDLAAAEEAQSRFVRTISQFELRLNDFKTTVDQGMDFAPSNFARHFDFLNRVNTENFTEHFFEILYSQVSLNPNANVLGYALKRFAFHLTNNPKKPLSREYLQRLIFATPFQVRWILPLLFRIYQNDRVSAEVKRLFVWGIQTCGRRNDIGNLLWFLYGAIFLGVRVNRAICESCFELSNGLVDLMLFHGRELGLFSPPIQKLRDRYWSSDFRSASWLPLYEVGRRNWDNSRAFTKIGRQEDEYSLYQQLQQHNVEFYSTDNEYLTLSAFEGWNLQQTADSAKTDLVGTIQGSTFLEHILEETGDFHSGLLF